jgi:teichuronic acid biosynthesis protein TuaE
MNNLSNIKYYAAFLAIWLLYASLSIIWGQDPGGYIRYICFLTANISVVLTISCYFSNFDDLQHYFKLWISILAVMVILGLINMFTGYQFLDTTPLVPRGAGLAATEYFLKTPRGLSQNRNDYATYLALSIPFLISFLRHTKSIIYKWAGIGFLLITIYVLVYTLSRGNYLGLLAGVAVWFLFLERKIKNKLRIVITIVILAGFLIYRLPGLTETVLNVASGRIEQLDQYSDASVMIRQNLIKNAFEFIVDSFGLGIGAGNSDYYMIHFGKYDTSNITTVHNWWVEIILEYGIPIFVLYVIFYMCMILNLWRIYFYGKLSAEEEMICTPLIMSLIVFAIGCVSSSSVLNDFPMWGLFGFCLAFINYARKKGRTALV